LNDENDKQNGVEVHASPPMSSTIEDSTRSQWPSMQTPVEGGILDAPTSCAAVGIE